MYRKNKRGNVSMKFEHGKKRKKEKEKRKRKVCVSKQARTNTLLNLFSCSFFALFSRSEEHTSELQSP